MDWGGSSRSVTHFKRAEVSLRYKQSRGIIKHTSWKFSVEVEVYDGKNEKWEPISVVSGWSESKVSRLTGQGWCVEVLIEVVGNTVAKSQKRQGG